MNGEQPRKVTPSHLVREACLYVRQAVQREGVENAASLQRQYNLRQQAVAFGWPVERVMVIDSDVGQSGVSCIRPGFQKLLQRIRRGRVGIVIASEPSRLTRNFSDWQRLLDACALSNTLVLYGETVLDPRESHDRTLLGCDEMMLSAGKPSQQQKEALV